MARLLAPLALLFASADGTRLRNATAAQDFSPEVEQLRKKLERISTGLSKMETGALAKTEVGPEVTEFNQRLWEAVNSTQGKSDNGSLQKLKGVFASVKSLVTDLNKQQMRLMQEGQEQQSSLLLGVLLTRKADPMDKQLEVIRSPDFASLPVCQDILAKKDMKTPLFQQVAAYLDAHGHKEVSKNPEAYVRAANPAVTRIVSSLQARLHKLEESSKHAEELHANNTRKLEAEEKSKPAKAAHVIHLIRKKEDRKFQKAMAMKHRDIQSMKDAIDAIEKGDMQGLEHAKAALEASINSMQTHNSGFLVLIQEGFRAAGMDCPFCAAQCVDKCHDAGKSYVDCLKDCQDAGK
jgi:hypothetical protein